jgi:hypothetical protein
VEEAVSAAAEAEEEASAAAEAEEEVSEETQWIKQKNLVELSPAIKPQKSPSMMMMNK